LVIDDCFSSRLFNSEKFFDMSVGGSKFRLATGDLNKTPSR